MSTPFVAETHAFEQVNHWGTAELSYALGESNVKRLYMLHRHLYMDCRMSLRPFKIDPIQILFMGFKLNGEAMLGLKIKCGGDNSLANIYGFSPSIRFDAVINRFVRQAFFEEEYLLRDGEISPTVYSYPSRC